MQGHILGEGQLMGRFTRAQQEKHVVIGCAQFVFHHKGTKNTKEK